MRTQIFLGSEVIYLELMEQGSRMVAFYAGTRNSEISTSIVELTSYLISLRRILCQ